MRHVTRLTLAAAALSLAGSLPAAAQSTTRIETRPFYGATVTLEEGVRVFRPLPADDHVIINPEGKTPLSLQFNETNVYEHRIVKNYNYGSGSDRPVRYSVRGLYGGGYTDRYFRHYEGGEGHGGGASHHGAGALR